MFIFILNISEKAEGTASAQGQDWHALTQNEEMRLARDQILLKDRQMIVSLQLLFICYLCPHLL